MPDSLVKTVITSIHQMTPRVKQFVLRTDEHLFQYKPGQHTRVVIPRENDDDLLRPYTPVNLPSTKNLVLAIKTYEEGSVSAFMHERRPGDMVHVQSLGGNLYVRDQSVPIVMASTGTGITPMLAMLRQLIREGNDQPITFFFGERTRSDLMYRETLDLLAAEHDNLRVVYVLSHEEWAGPTGFVQEYLETYIDDFTSSHFYVCGVPAMVVATENRLKKEGAPQENVISEGWEAGVV